MSCLSQQHEPGDARGQAAALDLLDEHWFFSNTLVKNNNGKGGSKPPLPRSSSTSTSQGRMSKGQQGGGGKEGPGSGCRRLLRTPSLPSPRVGMMEMPKDDDDDLVEQDHNQQGEVDDDDLNWSSIYEGVLRTRIAQGGVRSELHRAPSMPVPSSAMDHDDGRHQESATKPRPSMSRLRHSYSTLERHCRSATPTKTERTPRTSGGSEGREPRREVQSLRANEPAVVVRSKSAFQDSKWKSSSDLEWIEVQGFKDLGFVFDKEELRGNLADVLPGLRDEANKTKSPRRSSVDKGIVRRPYLSEAWQHVQRSAPPALIRVQSAAEMKDQLRMWAQAVACNVRQER